MVEKQIVIGFEGRDQLFLTYLEEKNPSHPIDLHLVQFQVVGSYQLLEFAKIWREQVVKQGKKIEFISPPGYEPHLILFRELMLKIFEVWQYPYHQIETCHCRAVDTKVIDENIVYGAHTPQKVSALTSASTACGTCRPTVEAMINYRLQVSSN